MVKATDVRKDSFLRWKAEKDLERLRQAQQRLHAKQTRQAAAARGGREGADHREHERRALELRHLDMRSAMVKQSKAAGSTTPSTPAQHSDDSDLFSPMHRPQRDFQQQTSRHLDADRRWQDEQDGQDDDGDRASDSQNDEYTDREYTDDGTQADGELTPRYRYDASGNQAEDQAALRRWQVPPLDDVPTRSRDDQGNARTTKSKSAWNNYSFTNDHPSFFSSIKAGSSGFRDQISRSRSNSSVHSMQDDEDDVEADVEDPVEMREEELEIPDVSMSPPSTPMTRSHSSFQGFSQQFSSAHTSGGANGPTRFGSGAVDDISSAMKGAAQSSQQRDINRRSHNANQDDQDNEHPGKQPSRASASRGGRRNRTAPLRVTGVSFPLWSIVFLASCIVVGLSGFLAEEVMSLLGIWTPSVPSKIDRVRMQSRLENLQDELRSFQHAAAEIEANSRQVFEEVKAHLAKMKTERQLHQQTITNDMNELREQVLQMTSQMVEQEKREIQRHVAAAMQAAQEEAARLAQAEEARQAELEIARLRLAAAVAAKEEQSAKQRSDAEQHSRREAPRSDPKILRQSVIAPEATKDDVVYVDARTASRVNAAIEGASESSVAWPLLALIVLISVIGGLVGLRVHNINRRKRWFAERRRRMARLRHARLHAKHTADIEQDDEEIETVSLIVDSPPEKEAVHANLSVDTDIKTAYAASASTTNLYDDDEDEDALMAASYSRPLLSPEPQPKRAPRRAAPASTTTAATTRRKH
ncbi:TPA: hypothetical protein N0F65_006812 [Lagenidium giganteum]|uniref:Transmembrane protein n=1 Tax=Lagenidium giganteum TaxID=4803 RepID=A0AAV2ZES9_9STRA|nr:TPA: hypothetical protein N0F65_006812 [Lagenidium giganteum]